MAGLAGWRLALVVAAALAGAAAKIAGSLYGSRALFVDALTSVANIAALASIISYYHASMRPADLDHPYGHMRLKYVGALLALLAYMFVAGVAAAEVYYSIRGYEVGSGSWKAALVGAFFYALAIAASRNIDPVLRVYAGFTGSEIVESVVSTVASFLGFSQSYIYDLAGAIAILAYLLYEAHEATVLLAEVLTDKAAPPSVYELVRREASLRGFSVCTLRIRKVSEDYYAGDAVITPKNRQMPPDVAGILASELRDELLRRGIDLAIHVEYMAASRCRSETRHNTLGG